jgi:hypothetical protein
MSRSGLHDDLPNLKAVAMDRKESLKGGEQASKRPTDGVGSELQGLALQVTHPSTDEICFEVMGDEFGII